MLTNEKMLDFQDNFFEKPIRKWREITKNDSPFNNPPWDFDGYDEFVIKIKNNKEKKMVNDYFDKIKEIWNTKYYQPIPTINLYSENCPDGVNCRINAYYETDKKISVSCKDRYYHKIDNILFFS